MNFIVHQVEELEHIHIPNRHGVIKLLARAPVIHCGLAIFSKPRLLQELLDIMLLRPIKDRSGAVQTESLSGHAEVHLQRLPDIHAAWHPKWVENDIHRAAIRQKGHIFVR